MLIEDDDEEDDDAEETASEDEALSNNKTTSYTAISNTPTRITLLSTTNQPPVATIKRGKKGARGPKRKVCIYMDAF